jgi:O-antigen/teichoic acid export membrane protein
MLMGPFVVVLMGVAQVAVPEASRVFRRQPQRLGHFCLALGGAQAAAALLWGLTLAVVLPLGAGSAMLKESWGPASQMLPWVTLTVVASCFAASLLTGLRAMGAAARSLRAQLTSTVVYVVCSAVGILLGGGLGACWGAAAGNTIGDGVVAVARSLDGASGGGGCLLRLRGITRRAAALLTRRYHRTVTRR